MTVIVVQNGLCQKFKSKINGISLAALSSLLQQGRIQGVVLGAEAPLLKIYLCIASLRLQQFCHQPCYLCIMYTHWLKR